ncbi:hypothetical protein BH10PSE7_BH10PSE7_08000 [soil metagenome]
MPNPFFILTWARSGSYHLASLLNSAPDIVCHKELFKPKVLEIPVQLRRKWKLSLEKRDADPLGFLEKLRGLEPDKHVGFKLFPNHIAYNPVLRELFESTDWNIICLTRAPVDIFASVQKAKNYAYWTSKQAAPAEFERKIPFDPAAYDKFIKGYNGFKHRVRLLKRNKRAIQIDYSELADESKLQSVLTYIGSKALAGSLSSEQEQQVGPRPIDLFERPDEVLDYARSKEAAKS